MSDNELTRRLGLQHPVIQGPFGGGYSTVRLASAVSNLGGLGSMGVQQLDPAGIEQVGRELRAATERPFGLNLWISDHDPGGLDPDPATLERARRLFEPWFRELGRDVPAPPARYGQRFSEQIPALLEARPAVFSFVFGVPPAPVLAECRRLGILSAGCATTLDEARALDEAGVDLIVASGCEAGGHRPSWLARAEDSLLGTLALVPQVADRVRAPVIAAGGVVDGRGLRAVLELGAQAAQVGTAFLACEESGASPAHRQALLSPGAERTALSRGFSGRLARGLRGRFLDEMTARTGELAPFPVQAWFQARFREAALAAGREDLVPYYAGQAAPNLRHTSVPALMAALSR